MKCDLTDLFMLAFTACFYTAGTVFLFLHPEAPNFLTWGGLVTVQGGLFHGIRVYDQKRPDAGG